ncbi:MAG: arginine deiminase-related protein [Pseudomonadota bacterium]
MTEDCRSNSFGTAAYGGPAWQQRVRPHAEEIGLHWAGMGIDSEWAPLRAVLLHRPGPELAASKDPEQAQMLAPLDLGKAQAEHQALSKAYREQGIEVIELAPKEPVTPNQMFMADLFFMTPQGAVLARPASEVRAGEERPVARRLADLGVPLLKTLTGSATFEGADALWLDSITVLLGRGHRTNQAAIDQISNLLQEIGVTSIAVDMPFGTMHLMGMLRLVAPDLAIAWPRRTPHAAVVALQDRGYHVAFLPDEAEASLNRGLNFVTLSPRRILMVGDNPLSETFYNGLDIECLSVAVPELTKAAGAIGCLTGVLRRDLSA